MKLVRITKKKYQKKVLALSSGRDVGYSWSSYEGNEQGDYSVMLCLGEHGPEMFRLDMTHEELGHLVRYWNETESGSREKWCTGHAVLGSEVKTLRQADNEWRQKVELIAADHKA